MTTLQDNIRNCTKCPLYSGMPYGCKPVPGEGPSTARLMIVGEALGEDEALLGKPFQGQCGKLLDRMLSEAGLNRDEIFITNTVKCRPTKTKGNWISNRPPSKEEIWSCRPWLWDEIASRVATVKVVFCLGQIATDAMIGKQKCKLGDIVGKEIFANNGTCAVPMYHPSYVMVHSRSDYDKCVEIFRRYK